MRVTQTHPVTRDARGQQLLTTASAGAKRCVELVEEIPNSPTELFRYPSIGPQAIVPTFKSATGWVTNQRKECNRRIKGSHRALLLAHKEVPSFEVRAKRNYTLWAGLRPVANHNVWATYQRRNR